MEPALLLEKSTTAGKILANRLCRVIVPPRRSGACSYARKCLSISKTV